MADLLQLDKMDLDALRETANIGAGHAATALSQMTGDTIMITVPTITETTTPKPNTMPPLAPDGSTRRASSTKR